MLFLSQLFINANVLKSSFISYYYQNLYPSFVTASTFVNTNDPYIYSCWGTILSAIIIHIYIIALKISNIIIHHTTKWLYGSSSYYKGQRYVTTKPCRKWRLSTMFPSTWCLFSYIMISTYATGMMYKTNFYNAKSTRFRIQLLSPSDKILFNKWFLKQYYLQLYNEMTTIVEPSTLNMLSNPPPSLLHLSGYGEDFIKYINSPNRLNDTITPSLNQPDLHLLSDNDNITYKRHSYLVNDYFNPNFSAVLRSERSPGGCKFI